MQAGLQSAQYADHLAHFKESGLWHFSNSISVCLPHQWGLGNYQFPKLRLPIGHQLPRESFPRKITDPIDLSQYSGFFGTFCKKKLQSDPEKNQAIYPQNSSKFVIKLKILPTEHHFFLNLFSFGKNFRKYYPIIYFFSLQWNE